MPASSKKKNRDLLPELSAVQEDYLETIYHIIQEKQVARAKEIADQLKVSRASVTEALKMLGKKGLVNYAPYEVITMTGEGEELAVDIVRRHMALKTFFMQVLAVNEELAEESACRIEHAASPEIINRLIRFVDYLEKREEDDAVKIADGFRRYCGL